VDARLTRRLVLGFAAVLAAALTGWQGNVQSAAAFGFVALLAFGTVLADVRSGQR
jgi:hypothetical protein